MIENIIIITQPYEKKWSRTFSETIVRYSYVFWGAESEFEVEIALCPISFGDNLKKLYFRVDDGKIWHEKYDTKPD